MYDKLRASIENMAVDFGIDILGKKKTHKAHTFRALLWYVLRKHGFTFKEIGELCQRDHSTVIAALKKLDPSKNEAIIQLISEYLQELVIMKIV